MHSSVLTGRAAEPGHVSASGSRGIIHRQSGVVAVARPTGKLTRSAPSLVCIRTVAARANPLTASPSSHAFGASITCCYAATAISFRAHFAVRSVGTFAACPPTSRASACAPPLREHIDGPRFLAIFKPHAFRLQKPR